MTSNFGSFMNSFGFFIILIVKLGSKALCPIHFLYDHGFMCKDEQQLSRGLGMEQTLSRCLIGKSDAVRRKLIIQSKQMKSAAICCTSQRHTSRKIDLALPLRGYSLRSASAFHDLFLFLTLPLRWRLSVWLLR